MVSFHFAFIPASVFLGPLDYFHNIFIFIEADRQTDRQTTSPQLNMQNGNQQFSMPYRMWVYRKWPEVWNGVEKKIHNKSDHGTINEKLLCSYKEKRLPSDEDDDINVIKMALR